MSIDQSTKISSHINLNDEKFDARFDCDDCYK